MEFKVNYLLLKGSQVACFNNAKATYEILADTQNPKSLANSLKLQKQPLLIIDTYLLPKIFYNELMKLWPDLPVLAFDDYGEKSDLPLLGVINPGLGAEHIAYPGRFALFSALGPEYMPLPKTCLQERSNFIPQKANIGPVKRLLLVMGGGDPENQTIRILNLLKNMEDALQVDIVAGPQYGSTHQLEKICSDASNLVLHHNPHDFHALASNCDLAVTGGGLIVYEMLYLRVPVCALALATNQEPTTQELGKGGLGVNLGRFDEVSDQDIAEKLKKAWSDPLGLQAMSKKGRKLLDGRGASRLAGRILEIAAHYRGERFSLKDVTDEYNKSASEPETYKKACWGSREGMENRFDLSLQAMKSQNIDSWLDVGCGSGDFLLYAENHNFKIKNFTGIDVSPEIIQFARNRSYNTDIVNFRIQDFTNPVAGEPFELVTSLGVIQKCGINLDTAISRLGELVKPGGKLLITTKNLDWDAFDNPVCTPYPGHHWFRVEQIKQAFSKCGLTILKFTGFEPRQGIFLSSAKAHSIMVLATKENA